MNRNFSTYWRALISIILTIALSISLKAQTSFITEVEVSVNELTPTQNEKYQKILGQERVLSIKFIDLANLSEVQENGWLTLSLPDKDCTASVKAKYVSSDESGDFYWYGEVIKESEETEEECDCYEGFVNLMKHNGEILGTISLDDDKYEIQSIGGNRTVLIKKDMTELNLGCGNASSEGLNGGEKTVMPRNNGNCPVRVLALFTANGNNAVANIQNTINLSIAETNQALRNSQVSECDLELILVDVKEIQFLESDKVLNDLDKLIGDANIQDLRNEANADIVLVYTNGNYGSVIGVAGTLFLEPERALCVIEAADATSEFNTAHEVAHLFACRHESLADNTGQFEHAHEFKIGCLLFPKYRNTIMFSVATGRTIQHYSNPNVKFKKKATGVLDAAENWRQLRINACTVANFRDDDAISILNASIFGDGYSCPCSSVGLVAQVSGGAPGPYSLEWRTSTDGFNWSSVQGTSSNFSIILPCEIGEGVYVRLSVTSSDGQIDETFRFIETAEHWPGQNGLCQRSFPNNEDNINHTTFTSGNLFPNPVTDLLTLWINEDKDMMGDIVVLDLCGRLIAVKPEINLDKRTVQISTAHLHEGMYLLKFGHNKMLKFIKSSN